MQECVSERICVCVRVCECRTPLCCSSAVATGVARMGGAKALLGKQLRGGCGVCQSVRQRYACACQRGTVCVRERVNKVCVSERLCVRVCVYQRECVSESLCVSECASETSMLQQCSGYGCRPVWEVSKPCSAQREAWAERVCVSERVCVCQRGCQSVCQRVCVCVCVVTSVNTVCCPWLGNFVSRAVR